MKERATLGNSFHSQKSCSLHLILKPGIATNKYSFLATIVHTSSTLHGKTKLELTNYSTILCRQHNRSLLCNNQSKSCFKLITEFVMNFLHHTYIPCAVTKLSQAAQRLKVFGCKDCESECIQQYVLHEMLLCKLGCLKKFALIL